MDHSQNTTIDLLPLSGSTKHRSPMITSELQDLYQTINDPIFVKKIFLWMITKNLVHILFAYVPAPTGCGGSFYLSPRIQIPTHIKS